MKKFLYIDKEAVATLAMARDGLLHPVSNSSADAASLSIRIVLFFLDDVIFFSFFP